MRTYIYCTKCKTSKNYDFTDLIAGGHMSPADLEDDSEYREFFICEDCFYARADSERIPWTNY